MCIILQKGRSLLINDEEQNLGSEQMRINRTLLMFMIFLN